MNTKIEWTARVHASEPIDELSEFARDVKKGLIDSEMIPDTAWIESATFDWSRKAEVVLRWDSVNEMELTANYVPASAHGSQHPD